MRTLARAAIIVVVLGFGAVPMLHGGRPAGAKPGPSVVVSGIAIKINNWIPRIRISEPSLLLVLGMGLIVAAGVFPGFMRSRVRLSHLEAGAREVEKGSAPEKSQAQSNTLLTVESSARAQAQWPGQSRASDGTLG